MNPAIGDTGEEPEQSVIKKQKCIGGCYKEEAGSIVKVGSCSASNGICGGCPADSTITSCE